MVSLFYFVAVAVACLLPVVLLIPIVSIHTIIIIDFFTAFNFNQPSISSSFQAWQLSKLSDIEEQQPVFMSPTDITKESFYDISKDALSNSDAINKWNSVNWWLDNYGNESVLCKYVEKGGVDKTNCTIHEVLNSKSDNKLYIAGENKLLNNHELQKMVEFPVLDRIAPGPAIFKQLYMGFEGMGSDVHGAMGLTIFTQIVGEKKWWLFPVSQTPYLLPALNKNGFSIGSQTKIGKGSDTISPWVSKLERYVVTLQPGDVLLSPPWYWHGVKNEFIHPTSAPTDTASASDIQRLVIGVPTRYATPLFASAFKNNWLLTTIGIMSLAQEHGLQYIKCNYFDFECTTSAGPESSDNTRQNMMKDQGRSLLF